MPLTDEDIAKILKIVDESDYDEVHIEVDDLKLHLRRSAASDASSSVSWPRSDGAEPSAPRHRVAEAVPPARTEEKPAGDGIPEGAVAVRAPMVGTFYRSPSPGEKPFVEVGDSVEADSTVCLVEVMKLFNSVKAGVAGIVKQIPVENGSMVEYGQVLLVIEPRDAGA